MRDGEPDRLLGLPMDVSEYAPNTFTSALYVGILGDFSNYWIADSLALEMQRLVETCMPRPTRWPSSAAWSRTACRCSKRRSCA